jgi:uncharacterized membrane protein HdeD (DUF308 family)
MIMGDIQAFDIQLPREIVQYWGWFLAFGIALLLLGIAAVVRSVAATVATMFFFGWLLIIASAIEVVQAVMVGTGQASSTTCWPRSSSASSV